MEIELKQEAIRDGMELWPGTEVELGTRDGQSSQVT